MIYITAQPNEIYFYWQLGVQLLSFKRTGVNLNEVYILVGIHNSTPPLREWDWLKKMFDVNIIFYEYKNHNNTYVPCIRPYLIKSFFNDSSYGHVNKSKIFYLDSDVVFTQKPDFDKLLSDDKWYLSNCYTYISANKIKEKGGVELLQKMCDVIGVDIKEVENNNYISGGAQYLLKNTNYEYWDKVYNDCEKLYKFLKKWVKNDDTELAKRKKDPMYMPIQSWCADMWCVLWNAWKFGYKTDISDELHFSWSTNGLKEWDARKIYHNAGASFTSGSKLFQKTSYRNNEPMLLNLADFNDTLCTYNYVKLIQDFYKYKTNFKL